MDLSKTFYLWLLPMMAATSVQAQNCVRAPDCGDLGYTQTAAQCEAAGSTKYIKCPFDQTKFFCVEGASGGRELDWDNMVDALAQRESWTDSFRYSDSETIYYRSYILPKNGCLYFFTRAEEFLIYPKDKDSAVAKIPLVTYQNGNKDSVLFCFHEGDKIRYGDVAPCSNATKSVSSCFVYLIPYK